MRPDVFWPIVLVALVLIVVTAMTVLMMIPLKGQNHLLNSQQEMINRLTNLVSSKDLTAYMTLQASTQVPSESEIDLIPLDDESTARRLAKDYEEMGIDPMNAFSIDSNDNPPLQF